MIEVLMVVAVLVLLAALYLSTTTRLYHTSPHLSCVNNLKQVGIAFRIWAGDNGDKYPMQVSVTNGGTMEFVGSAPDTFRHFEVMSNELNTPKILICPKEVDRFREMATVFRCSSFASTLDIPFASNTNLSYAVGVEAQDIDPQRFLTSDHNLTNGTPVRNGLLTLTTNHLTGWTAEIHVNQGNVGLADGSVQGFSTPSLRLALENTGIETNRLAMP